MTASALPIDSLLRALADPTRRRVIEQLTTQPKTFSELASNFSMAAPSFLQHLKILELAGLIKSIKKGRVRTYSLESQSLDEITSWLTAQKTIWESRLNQFDQYALNLKKERERNELQS